MVQIKGSAIQETIKQIKTRSGDDALNKILGLPAIERYRGFQKQHRIMGYAIIGFFKKALEISGAKDVAIRFTVPIEEGKEFAELSITWS